MREAGAKTKARGGTESAEVGGRSGGEGAVGSWRKERRRRSCWKLAEGAEEEEVGGGGGVVIAAKDQGLVRCGVGAAGEQDTRPGTLRRRAGRGKTKLNRSEQFTKV